MLVSGAGLTLRVRSAAEGVDFEQRIDRPLEPFAFRGDWDVDCVLASGPVEVLNVMTRRGRAGARVEIREVAAPALVRKAGGETLVVYAANPVTAYGIWGEESLHPDDSILVDELDATEIALAAAGAPTARAVLIRLGHT
jgi:environmental stress-induced protein Ves